MAVRRSLWIGALAISLIIVGLVIVLTQTGRGGLTPRSGVQDTPKPELAVAESATPTTSSPSPTRSVTPRASPSRTPDLAERLARNPMPPRDYGDLARGFERTIGLRQERTTETASRIAQITPLPIRVGDQQPFWIGDVDVSRMYTVTATLRLLTEHLQMWVQADAQVDEEGLARSAKVFEEKIYPTNHAAFGEEWIPGIDADPRLVVLNAEFSGAAGYFSSANEYPRLVNPYSNEREMLVMNLRALTPGTTAYASVLAHEFQHMIHWHQDGNEDAWLNEGCAELAEDLNGYDGPMVGAREFAQSPDIQLNTWSDEASDVVAHYGASYLVLRYLLERYGQAAIRDLAQDSANGIASIEAVLARQAPATTFEELFADWLVANLLDEPSARDGRYGYREIDLNAKSQYRVGAFPYEHVGTVHQYAADYLELPDAMSGTLRISFAGAPLVKLVPNEAASGRFQWWSNRGDASHAYLERTFDLRRATTATLSFNLWYDIEEGWDYAYLRTSTDGGQSWDVLRGPHMTDENPNGNALGPGYTGKSGALKGAAAASWVREELDLGAYCGQELLLRFDYVTDDAMNEAGLCLDDIRLDAAGVFDDVEAGEEAWRAVGFIRHDNRLAQRYIVQRVEVGPEPRVRRLSVGADGRGEWAFSAAESPSGRAVLIISALAPVTTEQASYRLQIEHLP